jgi:hypothetical protein
MHTTFHLNNYNPRQNIKHTYQLPCSYTKKNDIIAHRVYVYQDPEHMSIAHLYSFYRTI